MAEFDEKYRQFLNEKKIPILILDNKWHQLFQYEKKNMHVKKIEQELRCLLQRQAKLSNEIKAVKKVKAVLAQDIVEHMNAAETEDKKQLKHQEKNQKMMQDLNNKTTAYEQELDKIPAKIESVNRQLMLESMNICYKRLKKNETSIQEMTKWIDSMREELKEKILAKQSMEVQNEQMYSYMHDVLGPNIVDVFDIKYRGKEES